MRKKRKKLELQRETLRGLERQVWGGDIVIRFTRAPCTTAPTPLCPTTGPTNGPTTNTVGPTTQPT